MNKQLACMIAIEVIGIMGPVIASPFIGLYTYYMLALLRPQFLWNYALPGGIAWSYYPAVATIIAALFLRQTPLDTSRFATFPNKLHIALGAFAFWVCLSYIMAIDQTIAIPWFEDYIKIFVMMAVSMVLVVSLEYIRRLYYLVCFVFAYIAYEANISYLQYGYSTIQSAGYGGYDDNGIGLMLAMAVPLCYFAWESVLTASRWLYLIFIPVLLHAIMLTFSRGAMLSLLVTAPFLLLRSTHRRHCSLALVFMFCIVLLFAGSGVRDRFFSITEHSQDGSAQSRFASWSAGLAIASKYPVFGAGIRNSNTLTYSFGADMQGRTIHNQYIQIAADMGYVGCVLYCGVLLSFYATTRSIRNIVAATEVSEERSQILAFTSGLEVSMIAFGVGAIFLSLDSVEMSYLLLLLAAQMQLVVSSSHFITPAYRDLRVQP